MIFFYNRTVELNLVGLNQVTYDCIFKLTQILLRALQGNNLSEFNTRFQLDLLFFYINDKHLMDF
jgi:hypothetical protein